MFQHSDDGMTDGMTREQAQGGNSEAPVVRRIGWSSYFAAAS